MKKFFTLFFILTLVMSYTMSAQNKRTILVERFTNTGCGPCAIYGPAFTALLEANADKLSSIEYHWYYPAASDPMYMHNPADPNARMSYYGQSGVPFCAMNGNGFQGHIANMTQAHINAAYELPTPIEMRMQHYFSPNNDSIYVRLLIKSDEDLTGNLRAHIVIIEKEIHFTSAPGSNGEKDFYNVVKKMLPSNAGTILPNFEAGDYVVIQEAWKLENIYNFDQLSAVGFLQNNTNKHVYQAIYSSEEPIEPFYERDACVSMIQNIPSYNCNGRVSPSIALANYGAEVLSSATIEISINDMVIHTEEWSGSIDLFETKNIEIGEFGFNLEDKNNINITVSNPNGVPDEYVKNNNKSYSFTQAQDVRETEVIVMVRTHNDPEGISWEILNDNGEIIAESEPYTQANTTYRATITFPEFDCYDFTIYSKGGLTNNGTGFYVVTANGGELFSGSEFVDYEKNHISYGAEIISINEYESNQNEIKIYPNPAIKHLYVESKKEFSSVSIFNSTGQKMFERNNVNDRTMNINLETYNKGIYFIRIDEQVEKFIVK